MTLQICHHLLTIIGHPHHILKYLQWQPYTTSCDRFTVQLTSTVVFLRSWWNITIWCAFIKERNMLKYLIAIRNAIMILKMRHDQGEWVTSQQFSILIFQYKSHVHLKCHIFIQIPSQSNIWFQRYEQFFNFKNNVRHKNLSPLLACNSKSIFQTSDSFPLIMSQICLCPAAIANMSLCDMANELWDDESDWKNCLDQNTKTRNKTKNRHLEGYLDFKVRANRRKWWNCKS